MFDCTVKDGFTTPSKQWTLVQLILILIVFEQPPYNNNLRTTATFLQSQGLSFYTGLIVLQIIDFEDMSLLFTVGIFKKPKNWNYF